MPRPQPADYPPYFEKYISLVKANSLSEARSLYAASLNPFYSTLPEEKASYRYAPDKWTLKDLLQHVIDTERVFAYRLLCISRGDQTPLPSFDENHYALAAQAAARSFASLKEEFLAVRKATDLLLASLSEEQLAQTGTASNKSLTANAAGFILFGHLLHHQEIIRERYLK